MRQQIDHRRYQYRVSDAFALNRLAEASRAELRNRHLALTVTRSARIYWAGSLPSCAGEPPCPCGKTEILELAHARHPTVVLTHQLDKYKFNEVGCQSKYSTSKTTLSTLALHFADPCKLKSSKSTVGTTKPPVRRRRLCCPARGACSRIKVAPRTPQF